jgi:hypothetical protein
MTTYSSVLFLGATGYIGGTVLQTILASSTPPSTITALVRSDKKAEALNSISTPSGTTLKAVVGDLSKADQLTELAKEHDIVINCANADSEDGIKALIQGMKQRRDKTGHRPLLIQTSGTGVLIDDAQGRYPSDRVGLSHTRELQRLTGRSTPTSTLLQLPPRPQNYYHSQRSPRPTPIDQSISRSSKPTLPVSSNHTSSYHPPSGVKARVSFTTRISPTRTLIRSQL